MSKLNTLLRFVAAACVALPSLASAHEVYVLSPGQISTDLGAPPFDMVQVALDNVHNFVFWGFITFVVISTVFFASLFRVFERALDPFFFRLKRYAHAVCRITVGLGLLAGAYYQAAYGPELPLGPAWGSLAPLITGLIVISALFFLSGYYVRIGATIALALFGFAVWRNGFYMLTYANYFGEFIVLLILGAHGGRHARSKASSRLAEWWKGIARKFDPYAFSLIRICFGVSLLYAALYAKILHNQLALQVAELPLAGHPFGVAHYLGFEPHFLVLGAAIIELIIASFFILGIEIRWTSIFLEFWLSLSLWWFGESVWPHLILIGIPIAFIMHGYDRYSLEGMFFKKKGYEPVF